MTRNNSSGTPIWGTVYIPEVNGAKKVKSNAQVAMNKNSRIRAEICSLGVAEKDSAPNSFFPNFWNCLKRVEIGNS